MSPQQSRKKSGNNIYDSRLGSATTEYVSRVWKETGIKVNVETVSWDDMRNKIAIAASGNKAAADVLK